MAVDRPSLADLARDILDRVAAADAVERAMRVGGQVRLGSGETIAPPQMSEHARHLRETAVAVGWATFVGVLGAQVDREGFEQVYDLSAIPDPGVGDG